MEPLDALLRLTALDRLPRSGWVQAGVPGPETVAGHVVGTALLVLALAPDVHPALDVDRAVALAVVHDAGEALTTDLPRAATALLSPGAKRAAEARASDELLGALSGLAEERGRESLEKETREARFVHLCDRLQLGVQLAAYTGIGLRGLDEFVATLRELDCAEFAPCAELQRRILARVQADLGGGRSGPA